MKSPLRPRLLGLLAAAVLLGLPLQAQAQGTPPTAESILAGAERVGTGKIAVYRKKDSVILSLPREVMGRPFIWYAEVVGLPAGAVSDSLEAGSILARFERHGDRIIVRDLNTSASMTGGDGLPSGDPSTEQRLPGSPDPTPFDERPIDVALNMTQTPPAIVAFPVAAETADGAVLIDVTAAFSGDIESVSARSFAALTGLVPAAVDPSRSYVDRVRATEKSVNIRSHITFLSANPQDPAGGPKPVSVVVGHSFVFLPDKPMAWRLADPRIGFMTARFTDYESFTGNLVASRNVITRYRLEKKNPELAVSDPVKPIVFYIGPGVPDRWRPYMKAGVEMWKPVLEKAGFSNAIMAIDAPSPQQDPDWSVEDVSQNVIRWMTSEHANALGPHVIDPRTGEVLAAHVLIWPSVLDYFSKYYFALFGTVDPEAAKLPLSTDMQGRMLTYVVAHEVGHTLGLRHNHIASTAYSVADMRNPAFANEKGPNSSIMAYGRFNQVAQPGDGVSTFYQRLGPYDYAAIEWGYGDFGNTPAEEEKALAGRAQAFSTNRELYWSAGEYQDELKDYFHDPRVQRENTGAERVDATRLGVANVLRSLGKLDEATGGDDKLFTDTLTVMMDTQRKLIDSVALLVGGAMPRFAPGSGPRIDLVPAEEQTAAVYYLLGEGARSLEPYADPAIADRIAVTGNQRLVGDMQAGLLKDLLTGRRIALLDSQSSRAQGAYSPAKFGADVAEAVWGNLEQASPTERVLQRAYVAQTRQLIADWGKAAAMEAEGNKALIAAGLPAAFAALEADTGDDTVYPGWLRNYLAQLKARLDLASRQAAEERDRLHFSEMAYQVQQLVTALQ